MAEVGDIRGDLVGVGDTIAYAATDGRSSGMRVGKVLDVIEAHTVKEYYDHESFYERKVPTKLKVAVEFSSGYSVPGKPVLIEPGFKRFVKVGQ